MIEETFSAKDVQDMHIVESPLTPIVADFAKNGHLMTHEAQNAIAQYISIQSYPMFTVQSPVTEKPLASPVKDHSQCD